MVSFRSVLNLVMKVFTSMLFLDTTDFTKVTSGLILLVCVYKYLTLQKLRYVDFPSVMSGLR